MPGIRDDIIIKKRTLKGAFRAAKHETKQIKKHGLLAECEDLDKKLHDTYIPFRDTLLEVTEEMKNRVTKKVIP